MARKQALATVIAKRDGLDMDDLMALNTSDLQAMLASTSTDAEPSADDDAKAKAKTKRTLKVANLDPENVEVAGVPFIVAACSAPYTPPGESKPRQSIFRNGARVFAVRDNGSRAKSLTREHLEALVNDDDGATALLEAVDAVDKRALIGEHLPQEKQD